MRPQSAKAKGRRLQQQFRDLLIEKLDIHPEDIENRSMGAGGEDLIMARAAREKFPYSIEAVVCLAFTNDIPTTVKELELMCEDASLVAQHREGQVGTIAVAYTLWSYKKGAGRKIMKELKKYVKKIHHLNKIVTLSPLTPVATHYHISNGARLIQVNPSSQNFEYKLKK